jgi:hypothetical protein
VTKSKRTARVGRAEPSLTDLEKWIAHTGYPLEMRCAAILERVGFHEVIIGPHFIDPDQPEVLHEIDVVGSLRFPLPSGFEAVVRVVCECKYSKGNPWISLTWHRPLNRFNPYSYLLGTPGAKRFFTKNFASLPGATGLPSSLPIAYHVIQFHDQVPSESTNEKKLRDDAHIALERVTRAGLARVNSITANMGASTPIFEVVIPTVVLDGSLYIGEIGESGSLKLRRARASLLLRDRIEEAGARVQVQLITLENFEQWSNELRLDWTSIVGDHPREILASIGPDLDTK